MTNKLKFWLNVDKPTQTCTLHESDCVHVINKQANQAQEKQESKPDDNWHGFETKEQAEDWYTINFAGFGLIPCAGCF
jgi:hypothetical protein